MTFLMHRVELKEILLPCQKHLQRYYVPNAPCGVERIVKPSVLELHSKFLMHRVELKVACKVQAFPQGVILFLMHRVELKEHKLKAFAWHTPRS